MKISNLLYMGALSTLALMSCTNNDDNSEWYGSEGIVFTTAIQSRVSGNTWNANDEVGIYMMNSGSGIEAATAQNKKYIAQTNGTLTAASGNGIYLPESGSVDFIAYYPYTTSVSGNKIAVNVSDQSKPAAIDLIYSNGTKGIEATSATTVDLAFTHQLTKITLNVTKDATVETLSGLGVTMKGISTEGEFNLADGTLTATAGTNNKDVAMYIDAQGTTATATATAIILPTAASTDQTSLNLTFNLNGQSFTHTISDASIFEKGTNVSFNANLSINNGKPVVTVGNATINNWTEKPGGDINVGFDGEGQPQPGGETVILDESFATGQGSFTIDNKQLPNGEGSFVWNLGSFNDDKFMKASAYIGGTKYASESWLVSPPVDLTQATTATLTFDHAHNYAGTAEEEFTLWATETSADNWQQLTIDKYGSGFKFTTATIDLSAYAGKTIKFAFKYVSTTDAAGTWEIKNVKVVANGEGGGTVDPKPEPEPGINLLTNPGFEDWTNKLPTAWDNDYNTGEIIKETTIKHSGNNSLRQTSADKATKIQQEVTVTPGKKYRLSYWYLDNDNKARTRCWFAYNSGDPSTGMQPNDYSTDNPEWQQVVVEITVPEGATILRFEARTYRESTTQVGGYIYYDDMEMVEIQ